MIKIPVSVSEIEEVETKVANYLIANVAPVDYVRTRHGRLIVGDEYLWKIGRTAGLEGRDYTLRVTVNNHRGQIGGDVETMLALMFGNIE